LSTRCRVRLRPAVARRSGARPAITLRRGSTVALGCCAPPVTRTRRGLPRHARIAVRYSTVDATRAIEAAESAVRTRAAYRSPVRLREASASAAGSGKPAGDGPIRIRNTHPMARIVRPSAAASETACPKAGAESVSIEEPGVHEQAPESAERTEQATAEPAQAPAPTAPAEKAGEKQAAKNSRQEAKSKPVSRRYHRSGYAP
jgi:hypothetical protein